MPVDLGTIESFFDWCELGTGSGTGVSNFVKPCFFIYPNDEDNCSIFINDRSWQVAFYDPDTDVHEVFVTIRDESETVCYTSPLTPFEHLNVDLPGCGFYIVEIDVRYTIQYDDSGEIIPFTFQKVYLYPVECNVCGDHHNKLLNDIKCRIARTQCEINKRRKVGRKYDNLYERIYALNNYMYLICNYNLSLSEYDTISGAVKKLKKVC